MGFERSSTVGCSETLTDFVFLVSNAGIKKIIKINISKYKKNFFIFILSIFLLSRNQIVEYLSNFAQV